jgi:hypothetical protein
MEKSVAEQTAEQIRQITDKILESMALACKEGMDIRQRVHQLVGMAWDAGQRTILDDPPSHFVISVRGSYNDNRQRILEKFEEDLNRI